MDPHTFGEGVDPETKEAAAPEPQDVEPVSMTAGRITIARATVMVGDHEIHRDVLHTWSGWTKYLEPVLRRLTPPPTPHELDFLVRLANTPSAHNGYEEVRQAFGRTRD